MQGIWGVTDMPLVTEFAKIEPVLPLHTPVPGVTDWQVLVELESIPTWRLVIFAVDDPIFALPVTLRFPPTWSCDPVKSRLPPRHRSPRTMIGTLTVTEPFIEVAHAVPAASA